MVNVLWIDDHCMDANGNLTALGNMVCDQAYNMGIDITPFNDYRPALAALQDNKSKWQAIILDVQNENKQTGGLNDDFHEMKRQIAELHHQNRCQEPYVFVFSGIEQYQNSDLMPKEAYASRSVYAKPNESGLMFEDILRIANASPLYQITVEHSEVFDAVGQLEWDGNSRNDLVLLIYSIENLKECKDHSLLPTMRKLLEGPIMGYLASIGFFSEEDSSLNKRSLFISKSKQVPTYVKRALHSLVEITNNGSHFSDGTPETAHLITANHVAEGRAPYVLRSCLYDLLTVILWVKDQK